MKATRHNGRSGKHGSYNPKHNDRNFDLENSEHIDVNMAMQNIYWDCYIGKRTASSTENYESFDAIELRFYEENYSDFIENQNRRNAINRHTERNRTIEDIYKNKKTCPEESIYQLGNMDVTVKSETLTLVTEDFLAWFEEAFGQFVHIIDWALHVDEATPHIHERHVFDAPNNYGENAPQQDKALELLGFELPYPDKPKSKSNNRKIVFDAVCRSKFLEICEEYGLSVDKQAEYGGKKYLEKNDFIIQNQRNKLGKVKEELVTQEKKLDSVKTDMAAIDTVIECLANNAYISTCEMVIAPAVTSVIETDIEQAEGYVGKTCDPYGNWLSSDERKSIKSTITDMVEKIKSRVGRHTRFLVDWFMDPERKEKNVGRIKESMWNQLEKIAVSGLKEEELNIDKSIPEGKKEEVAEQVQEVATQMVRRRRGR